jgi:predicted transcriptional regulator
VVPKPLTVRFDEDLRGRYDDLQERLTRVARRHYRSLNGEMLAALESWLAQSDEPCTIGPGS